MLPEEEEGKLWHGEGSREIYEEHSTAINIAGSQGAKFRDGGQHERVKEVVNRCNGITSFYYILFKLSKVVSC